MPGAVQKAYLAVRERIIRGTYAPAMRLTELEICDVAGVSRTPVREALRRLQADGFVTVVPNHGAVVMNWTADDAADVFELRALLESYGAARAAERITRIEVAELKKLASEQYDLADRQPAGYLERIGEINGRFHRKLLEVGGNRHLIRALAAVIEGPVLTRTFSYYTHGQLIRSAAHHLELVSALEAGDADWAAAVMKSHIRAARLALRPK